MSESAPFESLFSVPLRNGVSYPSKQRGSGVPMVNMRQIFAYDRIADQDCERVPLTRSEIATSILMEGDLLFARQSLVFEGAGRCVIVQRSQEPMTWESHLIRVRLDETLACADYYYYYFRSNQGRSSIESIVQQVAAAGIRGSDLRRLMVPTPPVSQQQAIAEVLGALDDKISANRELLTCSARLALAVFDGALQKGALDVRLGDVATSITRGITPLYTNAPESPIVLNQKCIRDQRVSIDPARLTDSGRVRSDKILEINDVLINSTGQGTLGRVARWTRTERATVDSHVTIVRFDKSKVDPVCAGYGILRAQPAIQEMGEGSTGQTELSRVELSKLRIAVPTPDLQGELGSVLADLVRAEDSYLRQNSILAEIRDVLLPQLMSGKLRVKDAEKQVEAVV